MLWKIKPFEQLTGLEVYRILQLRTEVFILEQACLYQDIDDKDPASKHVWLEDDQGQILAYCRLLPPGLTFDKAASIGRVIVKQSLRGQDYGRLLLEKAIDQLKMDGQSQIRIEAQEYAEKFYAKVGFQATDHHFLEDGIPHLEMFLDL